LQIISETLQPWPAASARAESGRAAASFAGCFGSNSTAIFPKKLSQQNDTTDVERSGCQQNGFNNGARRSRIFIRRNEMATKPAEQQMLSTRLIAQWEQICQKLTALAEEFPAGKFDFKPAAEVRSVAAILRHVAFWNNYVADSARGKNPDGAPNELPEKQFSTKAQIIDAFNRSAAHAAAAFRNNESNMPPELAETLVTFIEHNCEHYGQLAVYARLNRIVPPASRG
jgi:uncharacterized damage-inducible protein DinB